MKEDKINEESLSLKQIELLNEKTTILVYEKESNNCYIGFFVKCKKGILTNFSQIQYYSVQVAKKTLNLQTVNLEDYRIYDLEKILARVNLM